MVSLSNKISQMQKKITDWVKKVMLTVGISLPSTYSNQDSTLVDGELVIVLLMSQIMTQVCEVADPPILDSRA